MTLKYDKLTKEQAIGLNPQVLAFIGDSVHTLITRVNLAMENTAKSGLLHKLATNFVSAVAQARRFDEIESLLTEEEIYIFKRGRNVKVNSVAKNATLCEYKKSTGFEAVIGYLFLTGQTDRIYEII